VRLKNVKSGTADRWPADGVFIAIGHRRNRPRQSQIKLKSSGYVEVAPIRPLLQFPACSPPATSRMKPTGRAVTAAGLGCMAALEAERFLALRASDRAAAEYHA